MNTKTCYTCKEELPFESFAQRYDRKAPCLQSNCRKCHAAYRRKHYLDNKKKYIDKAKIVKKALVTIQMKKLKEYFLSHPCIDCGETNPFVLDFDHVRDEKTKNVSSLMGCSWRKIEAEIAKCEVRCSNCHRIKTAKQLGYYKYLDDASEALMDARGFSKPQDSDRYRAGAPNSKLE